MPLGSCGGARAGREMTELDTAPFTFVDVETTGLSPAFGHRVCEIALLQVRGRSVAKVLTTLVNPRRFLSQDAFEVNGITAEMLEGAPSFLEIADGILGMVGDSVVIAHNARFDLSFLAAEFAMASKPMFSNRVLDTLLLARRCYNFESNSLGRIARDLELPIIDEHRAMADVLVTRMVFERFLSDLRPRGVTTVEQLISLQGGCVELPLEVQVPQKPSLPSVLEDAIRNSKRLQIGYVASDMTETQRVIDPLEAFVVGGKTYIYAYCHLREGERSFRLDRIVSIEVQPL
jgi:DNA polymerase III epsilon subunit family exonuclease